MSSLFALKASKSFLCEFCDYTCITPVFCWSLGYICPYSLWHWDKFAVSSSVSLTIPTILTTRRSLPLSATRMLSRKESVESDSRVGRRALCCKEKNALIERAHRNETLDRVDNTTFEASSLKCEAQMNEARIRLKEFPYWIFLFHCRLLTSSANLRVVSTSVRSQPCFNVIFLFHCRLVTPDLYDGLAI